MNYLFNRSLNAGALGMIYMLFSILSEIFFENDLGLELLSSSPLLWIIFTLFLLIISPIAFRLVGIKPIEVDLF